MNITWCISYLLKLLACEPTIYYQLVLTMIVWMYFARSLCYTILNSCDYCIELLWLDFIILCLIIMLVLTWTNNMLELFTATTPSRLTFDLRCATTAAHHPCALNPCATPLRHMDSVTTNHNELFAVSRLKKSNTKDSVIILKTLW